MIIDLEFRTESLAHAPSTDEARRATDAALALVYRIQDALKGRRGAAYWADVDGTADGILTGAVNVARNVNTHSLVIESRHSEVYPSRNVFPGAYLTLGPTFRWADYGAIAGALVAPRIGARDRRADYRGMLSQRAVVPTLRRVGSFYRAQLTAATPDPDE